MPRDYLREDHRFAILKRVLAHAFDDREADLEKRARHLVQNAVEVLLGDEYATFKHLPSEWFPMMKEAKICGVTLPLDQFIHVPMYMRYGIDIEGTKWCEAAEKLDDELEDTHRQRREMGNKVYATLRTFKTFGALEKGWPEIWPFARNLQRERPANLPANLDEMNTVLDLPPAEMEASRA